MSRKKVTPLILIGGIIICLFVIMSSYAYWQLTKKQTNPNDMVSACLNFEMKNASDENNGISLENAWPISDEEGRELEGYTFIVENKCDKPVDYAISLESLENNTNTNYLNYKYIKVAVDDETEKRYDSLMPIDNVVLENDTETIRDTKEVTTATVAGKTQNTHTIRLWISSDAPVDEQNKSFLSRVRITGGQGIENNNMQPTADACFEIDENTGEITKYYSEKEECGKDVVIPARVNGNQVKTIDTDAFRAETTRITYYNGNFDEVTSFDKSEANVALIINNYIKGNDEYNIADLDYAITYTDDEGVNNTLESYSSTMEGVELYYYGKDTLPQIADKQLVVYHNFDENLQGPIIGSEYYESGLFINVEKLDLTNATYLDYIEEGAFSNVPTSITNLDDYDNYETSLTSLKLSDNRQISLGHNAFARINVENLEIYAPGFKFPKVSVEEIDEAIIPFGGAIIENLTLKESASSNKFVYDLKVDNYNELLTKENWYDYIIYSAMEGIIATNVIIDEGITLYDGKLFVYSTIGTLTLPNSINLVDSEMSNLITSIGTLRLPTNLVVVPEEAFQGCQIKAVVIPNTVTTIENHAFSSTKLTYLTIPSSVTYIGDRAFNTTSLSEIVIKRSDNTGITFGTDWKYSSTRVIYSP